MVNHSTILHESKGLRITQNAKNHFCVVTLHYTADPTKCSPAWEAEARAGLRPAQFEQEYNISYEAMMGEKVFPEFLDNRSHILVHAPFPEWAHDQPYWGGFDFGARNPSSFHVYTIEDEVIYVLWELYEPCKNIPEFCTKLKACPYYPRLRYIAADPTIFDKRHFDAKGNPTSMANLFAEQQVCKLVPGNNNEDTFVAEIRRRWSDPEGPSFRIYDTCVNMIHEFEIAMYPQQSDRQLAFGNFKERMIDKDNHALDDCKYYLNSRPRKVNLAVKLPNMIKQWAK